MTNRLELNWQLDGFVDEQRYYCSDFPFDIDNMPTPKTVLTSDVRTYVDSDVVFGKRYYLCVSSFKNNTEKFGQQISVRAGLINTVPSATSTINKNTDILTMNVPADAVVGDKLLVVLRARVDRNFIIPVGWTLLLDTKVPENSSSTSDLGVYILVKDYGGESELSFTQNTSAACSGMVILVKGTLGSLISSFQNSISYNKTTNSSYMLVLSFDNNYGVVNDDTARVSSPVGYAQIGHSYFINSTEYYGIFADTKGFDAPGTQLISINWPSSSDAQRMIVAIEINQG